MENLIEELTKVNPANLSKEGLKLFNKINEIIDRNRKLEKQMGKDLDVVYLQGVYNERDRWKSKVREKIEELKNEIKVKRSIASRTADRVEARILNDQINELYKAIKILEQLLQEGDK